MNDWWWRFRTRVACLLFHRRHRASEEWELVRMPIGGNYPTPGLWRVWTYCRVCGRGWTTLIRQKERGFRLSSRKHSTFFGGPYDLPAIPDCSFHTSDGHNPREV